MSDIRVSFPRPCDQPWEEMEDRGCNRHCVACDQTIFDLEKLTVDDAEALLDGESEACVRARVGFDGLVAVAKGEGRESRVIKAALGVAATLALAACATPQGKADPPGLSVSGTVKPFDRHSKLELVGGGRTYKIKPRKDLTFRFVGLEPGSYTLSMRDDCGRYSKVSEVSLEKNSVQMGEVFNRHGCITVGKMERAAPPSLG